MQTVASGTRNPFASCSRRGNAGNGNSSSCDRWGGRWGSTEKSLPHLDAIGRCWPAFQSRETSDTAATGTTHRHRTRLPQVQRSYILCRRLRVRGGDYALLRRRGCHRLWPTDSAGTCRTRQGLRHTNVRTRPVVRDPWLVQLVPGHLHRIVLAKLRNVGYRRCSSTRSCYVCWEEKEVMICMVGMI